MGQPVSWSALNSVVDVPVGRGSDSSTESGPMPSPSRKLLPLAVALAVIAGVLVAGVFSTGSTLAGAMSNKNQTIHADFAGGNYTPGAAMPTQPKVLRLWDDGTAWCNLETVSGWNWAPLDSAMSHAQPGATVVMVLGLTPQWARKDTSAPSNPLDETQRCPADHPGYSNAMPSESAWNNYVSAVATRFRDTYSSVTPVYEVWNEPGLEQFWDQTPTAMADMATLTKDAFSDVKAVEPSAQVLSASLTPRSSPGQDKAYLAQLTSQHVQVDGVAFHSYSFEHGTSPADADLAAMLADHIAQVKQVKQEISGNSAFSTLPLWETEVNHNLSFDAAGNPQTFTLSGGQQVELLAKTFMDDLSLGVNHEIWYAYGSPFAINISDAEVSAALQKLISWVAGKTFQGCVPIYDLSGAVGCTVGAAKIEWAPATMTLHNQPPGKMCSLYSTSCWKIKNGDVTLTTTPRLIEPS